MKNTQAGFLTLGSSYSLRLPTLILRQAQDEGQWLIASFVPDYSGGSVLDFLHSDGDYEVPFSWIPLI